MKKSVAKRLLCIAMVACMLLVGCGKQGETQTSEKPADVQEQPAAEGQTEAAKEKVTFQIAVSKHALCKSDDFNEMEIFKMAEEATGVHIDWIYVEDGATEKLNAMLTADLPDAFLYLVYENHIASNMDLFMDISPILEENAPHVVADYGKMQEDGMQRVTWPDGSIRSLMTGLEVSYQNDAESILVINKEWLDKLGMEVPTTIDEMYNVLCAFRDNDMNGNGDPNDEIPLELTEANWAGKSMNLANSWGIAAVDSTDSNYYYKLKDGKVNPTIDTQEYRSYLEFMHKLMAENLMDKEGFTQTNDQYYAKLKSGNVGMWGAWTPYSVMPEELASKYVPVRVMQAEEGITPVKSGRRYKLFANRTGFAITKDCENPERLLQWWDYLSSSTEIKYTMRYGAKGGYWDVNEEGKVYQKTPEGLTADFTVENYKQTYGMNDKCTLILKDEDILVSKEESFTTWVRVNLVDQVWDQLATEYLPIRFSDPAKVDERTFMETELNEYARNFTATSIMDGVDDAKWEAHLKQLKALQYYEWIQWYQDYVDGKF